MTKFKPGEKHSCDTCKNTSCPMKKSCNKCGHEDLFHLEDMCHIANCYCGWFANIKKVPGKKGLEIYL